MEISIRELKILKKYFFKLNLKIQGAGKYFEAPWRPGALYLSTPAYAYSCLAFVISLYLIFYL
jgi:hypothetical protein